MMEFSVFLTQVLSDFKRKNVCLNPNTWLLFTEMVPRANPAWSVWIWGEGGDEAHLEESGPALLAKIWDLEYSKATHYVYIP